MGASFSRYIWPIPILCRPPRVEPSVHIAEQHLLRQLTPSPYEKRKVNLPTGQIINTISAGDPSNPHLVLVHGWGAGLAFFGLNISHLSRSFRLHLLDWPGFGASSRPQHPLSLTVDKAEAYFLDAFQSWVQYMHHNEPGFDRFHLVGHSMGAYLSAVYALRDPRNLLTLTLASPVGIPLPPPNKIPSGPKLRSAIFWLVFKLWDLGFTPQVFMRLSGRYLGRMMARRIIEPRFRGESQIVMDAFVEYFYQISVAPAGGERSLSTILESGAYARRPLCERLDDLKTPTAFLYGEHDWMSRDAALKLAERMEVDTRVEIVRNAGHHLYYDNAQAFGELVVKSCQRVKNVVCKEKKLAENAVAED